MAINPEIQYPGKIAPSTPDYPYGEARNITVKGDGTGTPWEAALVNDLFGWQQALLSEAGLVPSGIPDKVGGSQYLEAMKGVIGEVCDTVTDLVATSPKEGQRLFTRGYYSVGDGGGGEYVTAAAQATDGYGDHEAVNGLSLLLVHKGTVDVRQYGVSTAQADNAAALTACFEAAKGGAFKITAYGGDTYDFQNDVIITHAKVFDIEGTSTFNGIGAGVYIKGELEELGFFLSVVERGGETVDLTGVGSIAPGDIVILWNSSPSSLSIHRTYYYDGEFAVVKSVVGNTLHFESGLETSYTPLVDNIAYKLDPVVATVKGVSFTGGSSFAFQIFAGAYSTLSPSLVRGDSINTASALNLSRCYSSKIFPGEIRKPYNTQSTAPEHYGISIANSQSIHIYGGDIYAGRHAVATGGDSNDAAVPCRDILVIGSVLKNDSTAQTHTADFHGNTINSYYINCTIHGWTAIGGRNCGIRGGRIVPTTGQYQRPFGWSEVVGGVIEFTQGIKVSMPEGSAALAGGASSITMQSVQEDFRLVIDDVDLMIDDNNTSGTVVIPGNYADGSLVEWSVQITNLRISGNVANLSRIVTLDTNNDAGFATPPRNLSTFLFDTISMDFSGLSFWVVNGGNAIGTGTIVTMPKLEKSQDVTILSGGFVSSSPLAFSFPSYIIPPNLVALTNGGSSSGGTFLNATCTASTATTANIILTTMHASETVAADITRRISARVGFDNFDWP